MPIAQRVVNYNTRGERKFQNVMNSLSTKFVRDIQMATYGERSWKPDGFQRSNLSSEIKRTSINTPVRTHSDGMRIHPSSVFDSRVTRGRKLIILFFWDPAYFTRVRLIATRPPFVTIEFNVRDILKSGRHRNANDA